MTAPTLDALMRRLAQGDRSVFTQVFERLWPPTLRLCRSLLKNDADAADAAQEAMHKIFERATDYDPSRPALPWALAIAGFECRTLAKKRVRRRETAEANESAFGALDPEQDFVDRDLVAAAMTALGELSPTDREALTATFWDQAASSAGATFRKRRERALARLRMTFRRLYGLT